jgi:hypothetical protein
MVKNNKSDISTIAKKTTALQAECGAGLSVD